MKIITDAVRALRCCSVIQSVTRRHNSTTQCEGSIEINNGLGHRAAVKPINSRDTPDSERGLSAREVHGKSRQRFGPPGCC